MQARGIPCWSFFLKAWMKSHCIFCSTTCFLNSLFVFPRQDILIHLTVSGLFFLPGTILSRISSWLPLFPFVLKCHLTSDALSCPVYSLSPYPLHFLFPFSIMTFPCTDYLHTCFIVWSPTIMYTLGGGIYDCAVHCQIPSLYNNAWPQSRHSITICWTNGWMIMLFITFGYPIIY